VFLVDKENLKESLFCIRCKSWLRLRFLAEQIVLTFSREGSSSLAQIVRERKFSAMKVYHTQTQGPLHGQLRNMTGYQCSEYFEKGPPGEEIEGVRCEDLQRLSFVDEDFDLLIHTSVLEHVPRPEWALKECHRVLKPDAAMIFEVPLSDPGSAHLRKKSIRRVDTTKEKNEFLLEPVYHGDPLSDSGSLVYTDLGMDIVDTLKTIGFSVDVRDLYLHRSRMSHVVVFICQKKP